MGKRLFVGGLPYTLDEQGLRDLFSQFGTVVSASVIIDKFTNQSKGFGFVEMEDDAQTEAAIAGLNGTDQSGRKISVDVARPREERPRTEYRGGGGRSGGDNRGGGHSNRW